MLKFECAIKKSIMKRSSCFIIFLALFLLPFNFTYAQKHTHPYKLLYHQAFEEQHQMLKGEIPFSFKRAVFLHENAYLKGKLKYENFCYGIDTIVSVLRQMIRDEGIGHFRSAGNWATFTYMKKASKYNYFTTYEYDFEDIAGKEDRSKIFVSKLMKTKSGQCVNLPVFYKILCDELNALSYLAMLLTIYISNIRTTPVTGIM